ncbi:DUF1150 family protein [Octadecabacter sp. R77987]|uniref:DUF1150 family protein n=1 Tax=Octadecabacter sp. R77987 TaxID=3093874 RepID=UPI00366AC254
MNTEYKLADRADDRLVYVKPVAVSDLPDEVRQQAGDMKQLFAVHNSDGEQLALVANRRLAFALALENDMSPMTLH